MSLWQIITGNSDLPVQTGNNFWRHLSNQSGGIGDILIGTQLKAKLEQELTMNLGETLKMKINDEEFKMRMSDNRMNMKIITETKN